MVWRVNPAHKKLQVRMENMRDFRRQHEQLRTVIMRVLRPNIMLVLSGRQTESSTAIPEGGDASSVKPDPLALEAADANAIEVCFNKNIVQLIIYKECITAFLSN